MINVRLIHAIKYFLRITLVVRRYTGESVSENVHCDRIEKEKSQLKAESDDLRSQIDHISKTKVQAHLLTAVASSMK